MPSQGLVQVWNTSNLEEHVALIARQVKRSCDDPETRQLAMKIVNGKADAWIDHRGERWPVVTAWGEQFILPSAGTRCPARDSQCEIQAIWDFVVANVRYVYDPPDYDLFCTVEYTLKAGGGDCFALDTKIIVRNKATGCYELRTLEELRTVWPAYDALSYDFASAKWVFSPITAWRDQGVRECVTSHLGNGPSFTHTPEHKVWWYDGQQGGKRVVERELGDRKDRDHTKRRVLVARKIPALGSIDITQPEAYLSGIYAAEGNHTGVKPKLAIAQSAAVNPAVVDRIGRALAEVGASTRYADRGRSGSYFHVHAGGVRDWLAEQGSNSFDMGVHPAILGGTEAAVRTALEAHGDGDAYRPKAGSRWAERVRAIHGTSSARLRDELQLMSMILGEPWHTQTQLRHGGVGVHPIYRVHRYLEEGHAGRRHIPELPGVGYSPVRGMEAAEPQPVADITVEGTHNFVLANGMIAHNCDDMTVCLAALLKCVGFSGVAARIVTQSGESWEHVYALVSPEKDRPRTWVALDPTVKGATPGWQFDGVKDYRDFYL